MILLKIILWAIALFVLYISVKWVMLPFIKYKIMLWVFSRRVKKMAKKYNGDLGEGLNNLADAMDEFRKEIRIDDFMPDLNDINDDEYRE